MSSSGFNPRNLLVLLVGIIAIIVPVTLIAPGCSDDSSTEPTPVDPSGVIATFEVAPDVLLPGESATLRVRIMDPDGVTPASGREVVFTELFGRRLGTFASAKVETDATGWATNTFAHDRGIVGYTNLKVSVGEVSAYKEVMLTPPLSDLITLVVVPENGEAKAIADGSSRFPYAATAYGTQTGEALEGLTIVLTSGEQFVDANGDGAFNSGEAFKDDNSNGRWDAIGSVPEQIVTDRYGAASFDLTAPPDAGTTYIHACAMGAWTEATMEFVPRGLKITVVPHSTETIADGYNSISLDYYLTDWLDNPIAGKMLRLTAGEQFEDANRDGEYTPGETFVDGNDNDAWDVNGQVLSPVIFDETGFAYVVYTASEVPGPVVVHAVCEDQVLDTTLRLYPSVATGRVTVQTFDDVFHYADGMTEYRIMIAVKDVNSAPARSKTLTLAAGEPFEDKDRDGLFTPGTDVLQQDFDGNGTWTAIGTVPETVVTDRYGDASVTYIAGHVPGTIVVRATSEGAAGECPITLSPFPVSPDLRIRTTPQEIFTRDTGRDDTSLIEVGIWDYTRFATVAGMPVSFRLVSGPGGMEELIGHRDGVFTSYSDGNGNAYATVWAGSQSGPVEIEVTAGQVSETVRIFVMESRPATVDLTSYETTMPFNDIITVQAYVKDASESPVRDDTVVEFRCDEGMIVGDNGSLSNTQRGVAMASFHSLGPSEGRDYRAVITAQALGSDAADTLEIRILDGSPASIEGQATDTDLLVGEQTSITVNVRDRTGGPARDGLIVLFSTEEGMVETWLDGQLRSGRADCTYTCTSPDADGDGVAVIHCALEGTDLSCDVQIEIPRGVVEPATVSLGAAASEISVRGVGAADQTILTARPLDARGRRYGADVPVTFRIAGGPGGGESINGLGSEATVMTDASGTAEAVLNAGTLSGTILVHALSGAASSDGARVTIAAGPPALLECAGVDSMGCGQEVEVKARVMDQYHNPVRNGTQVWFSADAGLVVGDDGLASSETVDGEAVATYKSPLSSACEAWQGTTVYFECRPLPVCSSTIRKASTP